VSVQSGLPIAAGRTARLSVHAEVNVNAASDPSPSSSVIIVSTCTRDCDSLGCTKRYSENAGTQASWEQPCSRERSGAAPGATPGEDPPRPARRRRSRHPPLGGFIARNGARRT